MEMVQPTLAVLTSEQIGAVHQYSLAILAETGLRVDDDGARRRFTDAGCRVDGDRRVHIPGDLVVWALEPAPGSVAIYDRLGEERFLLGPPHTHHTRFGVGVTTPITPGGTLALLNAELLGGVVLSQLVRAGAPIIIGSLPAGFDMKVMTSVYSPHSMLLNLACAEMDAHYGLPHSGTSGCVNGWGPDLQLAGTLWMNHLTACMGKVGLAPFVGGTFDSLAFAPTVVVYADYVIRQARQFSGGFRLDDGEVALDEIDTIGPAGNFLMAPQTLARFRDQGVGNLWPSQTLEQWQAGQGPSADTYLRKHTIDLLAEITPPEDHGDLMARGEAFIHPYESVQRS